MRPRGRGAFQPGYRSPSQEPRPQSVEDRPRRGARIERQDRPVEIPATPAQLASRIIDRANERQPADLLLRQTLARRRGLKPGEAAWISRSVFNYFRWLKWLDAAVATEDRVEAAAKLAARFVADPASFPDEELAARAVPAWVRDELSADPGWLRTLQSEAPLWLRFVPGAATEVTEALGGAGVVQAGPLPDSARYVGSEDLFRTEAFHAGRFEIQDLASQAVSHVCAPKPGEVWWDTCAGEGGKTLHLSALMQGKGLIWASDRAVWRLERLRQRAARAGCFNHRRIEWDGGAKPPTRTVFDGVLVDAPCTGLGTWARNPQARWTTDPDDVRELAAIQKSLLQHAAPSVKPGGRLVYAVCTLTRSETIDVAAAFSAAHPDFVPDPFFNPLDPGQPASAELTLWPQTSGGNGMYIAAWRRQAGTVAPAAEVPGDAPAA